MRSVMRNGPWVLGASIAFVGTIAGVGHATFVGLMAGLWAAILVGAVVKIHWDLLIVNPVMAGLIVILALALFGFFVATKQGLFESTSVAVVFVTVALVGTLAARRSQP